MNFQVESSDIPASGGTVSRGELYGRSINRVVTHGVKDKNWDNHQDGYQDDCYGDSVPVHEGLDSIKLRRSARSGRGHGHVFPIEMVPSGSYGYLKEQRL